MTSSIQKAIRRREIVALLRTRSEQRAPISAFDLHMDRLWHQTQFQGSDIGNEVVYRARLNCKGRLFVKRQDLIYPPPEKVIRKGRFNEAGDSIFYGAFGIVEPTWEILDHDDQTIRLFTLVRSQRIKNSGRLFTLPFGYGNQLGLPPPNRTDKISIDYFNSEVTRNITKGDDELYNASISLGRYVINRTINADQSPTLALIYPSVAADGVGANIAMKPELYDAHFSPIEAEVCCLVRGTRNIMHVVNYATVPEGSEAQWQFAHGEMMERIAKGMTLFGSKREDRVFPEIRGATDQNH